MVLHTTHLLKYPYSSASSIHDPSGNLGKGNLEEWSKVQDRGVNTQICIRALLVSYMKDIGGLIYLRVTGSMTKWRAYILCKGDSHCPAPVPKGFCLNVLNCFSLQILETNICVKLCFFNFGSNLFFYCLGKKTKHRLIGLSHWWFPIISVM